MIACHKGHKRDWGISEAAMLIKHVVKVDCVITIRMVAMATNKLLKGGTWKCA